MPAAPTRRQLLCRSRKLQQRRDVQDARRYRQRGLPWLLGSTLRTARALHRQAPALLRQAGRPAAGERRRVNLIRLRRAMPIEGAHKEVLP
jgi:hypothetical protein